MVVIMPTVNKRNSILTGVVNLTCYTHTHDTASLVWKTFLPVSLCFICSTPILCKYYKIQYWISWQINETMFIVQFIYDQTQESWQRTGFGDFELDNKNNGSDDI